MYYQKPKNLKYTDMCIYIDKHAYDENKTEEVKENIYKYIYFLSHMLAVKMKLFQNSKYYDDFALWYTTQIFYRLENPKQFEVDENGNPKIKKIKSILNYIRNTIGVRKVTFEQQEYSQVISYKDNDYLDYGFSLSDKINDNLDSLYRVEFDLCLSNCCKSIKKFLSRLPYKKDSVMFNNIYLSCLLTFLNSVTISNKDIARLNNLKYQYNIDILKVYKEEDKDPVILYHLDASMHDYILVLHRQIKHELSSELSQMSNMYVGTNSGIYALMMQELNGYSSEYGDSY